MKPNVQPVTRQLTQRTYLGVGYVHCFLNESSGEDEFFPCSEAEYLKLGEVGGNAHNPVRAGYTWKYSLGGTDKVDTPNTLLGVDEYCIRNGKAVSLLADANGIDTAYLELPLSAVDSKGLLNETVVTELGYGNSI